MRILAIETSCDETAVAVLEATGPLTRPKFEILSNVVSSQIKLHAKYGGVMPMLAAREHEKNLIPVFKDALAGAGIKLITKNQGPETTPHFKPKIDYLAVTSGPGLIPSLLIGVMFARTLAWQTEIPLIGINHLEGHIYSNWLQPSKTKKLKTENIKLPALVLIVSGGHTQLVFMPKIGQYKIIGETLDDAAGEAFDKVARMLNLGYPGGPQISKQAERGRRDAFDFPRPLIKSKDFNFSFSGLKTAVLYKLKKLNAKKLTPKTKQNISASFEEAVVETLVIKTQLAAEKHKVKTIMVSGGVAANKYLREQMKNKIQDTRYKIPVLFPTFELSTDNATMIGIASYFKILSAGSEKKIRQLANWKKVEANPNLRLK
jgi:N6-L-threonylcarbamoyladenine synthase